MQLHLLVEEQAIVLQKDLPFKTALWRSFGSRTAEVEMGDSWYH